MLSFFSYVRSPVSGLPKNRYTELDLLRSFAVIGMIVYHAAYDLQMFYGWPLDVDHGLWKLFERLIAITFLLLVGISFAISYDRTEPSKRFMKFLKRGLLVIGCGCLVSIATYIIDPITYVRFGVLQLIGVSIVILPLFIRLRYWNLVIAVTIIVAHLGFGMPNPYTDLRSPISDLLLPFGITSATFQTVDYFPLIPWFAVVLIGLVIGQMFYVDHLGWRSYLPKSRFPQSFTSTFTFPGRYALLIYLLHQPIILLIMRLV